MSKKFSSWHWQAFTSTISTTMVLVLLGLVVLFVLTAQELSHSVRENLTVTLVLQDEATPTEAKKLQQLLETRTYVNEIQYISSEQALEEQIETMGLDPSEFLGANPFSISMEIKMMSDYACNDSLNWISQELKSYELVSDVIYQKDLVESLNENLQRASLILLAVAALLVLISLSLINNTVRQSVYSRRFIIHTMKLVGAKWGFIRRPFLVRSFWIGILSALMAIGILVGAVHWAYVYDPATRLYVTYTNLAIMAGSVLFIGLILTVLCTFLSVTRYLYMRESSLY